MAHQPSILGITSVGWLIVNAGAGGMPLECAGDFSPGMPGHHAILLGHALFSPNHSLCRTAVARSEAEAESAEALMLIRRARDLHGL